MILIAYFHSQQVHPQKMQVILILKKITIIIIIILSLVITHLGENRAGTDLVLVTITTSQHQGPLPR